MISFFFWHSKVNCWVCCIFVCSCYMEVVSLAVATGPERIPQHYLHQPDLCGQLGPCCECCRIAQGSYVGSGDSLVVEHHTPDRKVLGLSPGRSGGRFFFIQASFLCWLLFQYPFHRCVTAVACKISGHSAKSTSGRLQLNRHVPFQMYKIVFAFVVDYLMSRTVNQMFYLWLVTCTKIQTCMWVWIKWHCKFVYSCRVYTEHAPR